MAIILITPLAQITGYHMLVRFSGWKKPTTRGDTFFTPSGGCAPAMGRDSRNKKLSRSPHLVTRIGNGSAWRAFFSTRSPRQMRRRTPCHTLLLLRHCWSVRENCNYNLMLQATTGQNGYTTSCPIVPSWGGPVVKRACNSQFALVAHVCSRQMF